MKKRGFTLISRACFLTKISKACKGGFTLIELLVVIVIIGILMGILLVSYQGTRKTARDGKRKADLEQIRSALQLYHADCGQYPASITFGSPLSSNCPGSLVTYMTVLPHDPLSAGGYTYEYSRPTDHTYNLCAYLEGGSGSVAGCGGNCGVTACNYQVNQP